jgi:hypothetical protein
MQTAATELGAERENDALGLMRLELDVLLGSDLVEELVVAVAQVSVLSAQRALRGRSHHRRQHVVVLVHGWRQVAPVCVPFNELQVFVLHTLQ